MARKNRLEAFQWSQLNTTIDFKYLCSVLISVGVDKVLVLVWRRRGWNCTLAVVAVCGNPIIESVVALSDAIDVQLCMIFRHLDKILIKNIRLYFHLAWCCIAGHKSSGLTIAYEKVIHRGY